MTEQDKKLQLPLLFIRLSVFLVMFMWTIDKFINPGHASKVYESFYYIAGLDVNVMYVIGVIELIILLKFVAGYKKKYTYGAVLALHAVSTLSSFKQYLAPFDGPNLLFFAAWPMLAACFALFILRDQDKKWSVD
jgi:putative oxidoreductase